MKNDVVVLLVFLAIIAALFIWGCGSVENSPGTTFGVADRIGSPHADFPGESFDGGQTVDSAETNNMGDSRNTPEVGPTCEQRCSDWCANGKEGSLLGCACAC